MQALVTFFREGGWSMFVVSAMGGAAALTALIHSRKDEQQYRRRVQSLNLATLGVVVAGLFSNLAAVCSHVSTNPEWSTSAQMPKMILRGMGEAMGPVTLGCMLLALTWATFSVRQSRKTGHSAEGEATAPAS